MKKIYVFFVIASMVALAACGDDEKPSVSDDNPTVSKQDTIVGNTIEYPAQYLTLKYGHWYEFALNFNSSEEVSIWSFKVDFIEQDDWNDGGNPIFSWGDVNEGIPKIIPPNSKVDIIVADRRYEIKKTPSEKSDKNLIIKFTFETTTVIPWGGVMKNTRISYMYYEITE